jgi:F-type H+-transporting ATPase subunit gamma
MAQSRQALRSRIRSVKNTRKITKAMEMIANAKLFKQRSRMEHNREYAQRLQETVAAITADNPDVEEVFMKPKNSPARLTIIFTSDMGLCGAYNANILKYAQDNLNPQDPIYLIGTSMRHPLQEAGFRILNEEPVSSDKLTFEQLKDMVEEGAVLYQNDEIGTMQVLYTRFVNTMTFRPEMDVLLPASAEAPQEEKKEGEMKVLTLFEPDPVTILDQLIPMMIQDVAYADWMEATTAEQGSRRVAMKTASDNADQLADDLQLAYNKARQAAITQEITEVVNGSNAV